MEHELRPEALASIAREETFAEPQAHEISTNTTHAAVSPKTRAETASTGLVPRDASTHTDRAVRTEASVDDKSSLAIDFEGEGGFLDRPSSARQFHRVLEGRAGGSCCGRGVAAAVAPESRAKLLMLEDAAHMTIFSHPTQIAEAVDELWGGALRYEEEL